MGATGKERVTAINSLFKQIIQILLPGYIRFLLGVSTDSACKIDETNEKLFNYKSNNLNETSLNNDMYDNKFLF